MLLEPFLNKEKILENIVSLLEEKGIGYEDTLIRTEFITKLKKITGAQEIILTNSGTSALHSTLLSLDCDGRSVVLCPTFTYAATYFAAKYTKANIVFVDTLPDYPVVDPKEIERIKKYTSKNTNKKFLLTSDIFGYITDYDKIKETTKGKKIKVVADACEALGSTYKNKFIHVRNTCLSFNYNKIVTCGLGGAILNPDYPAQVNKIINQGKIVSDKRFINADIGYNYRLSNINLAIGLAQLEEFDKILKKKQDIYYNYVEELKSIGDIKFFDHEKYGCKPNFWLTCILSEKKDKIIEEFNKKNIEYREFFIPLHLMYNKRIKLPNSERLYKMGLCLPSNVNKHNNKEVINAIRNVFR